MLTGLLKPASAALNHAAPRAVFFRPADSSFSPYCSCKDRLPNMDGPDVLHEPNNNNELKMMQVIFIA